MGFGDMFKGIGAAFGGGGMKPPQVGGTGGVVGGGAPMGSAPGGIAGVGASAPGGVGGAQTGAPMGQQMPQFGGGVFGKMLQKFQQQGGMQQNGGWKGGLIGPGMHLPGMDKLVKSNPGLAEQLGGPKADPNRPMRGDFEPWDKFQQRKTQYQQSQAGAPMGDLAAPPDFGGNQEMASGDASMGGDASMAGGGGWQNPGAVGIRPGMQKPRTFNGWRSMRGGRR